MGLMSTLWRVVRGKGHSIVTRAAGVVAATVSGCGGCRVMLAVVVVFSENGMVVVAMAGDRVDGGHGGYCNSVGVVVVR